MAFQSVPLLRLVRNSVTFPRQVYCHTIRVQESVAKRKEYRTENNLAYTEDPDIFGTLSGKKNYKAILEDEGDIKEDLFLKTAPIKSQTFTTKQYADLIKQYVEHKRLKEAIDVLEVKMLQEDRVKPENYIYNLLIGACADVGYTKKAFKLFNDMKRRALKPTGDTYTCLFHACSNSPWPKDGQKNALYLREHMIEKGIEPNLTNYNAMIKAFGRCGDLPTAFQIVDEMTSKKIKIRVHTFNHLLQACISDKRSGLRHALVVWRKLLKMREKPNIYSFNLMLKCVKDCELGTTKDIEELIAVIEETFIFKSRILGAGQNLRIKSANEERTAQQKDLYCDQAYENNESFSYKVLDNSSLDCNSAKEFSSIENKDTVTIEFVEKPNKLVPKIEERTTPNLLSARLQMQQVLALKEIYTIQDKFAVVGGQEDFLKEMEAYSVKPDIKTFTQMLPLLEETQEAELKLLDSMKSFGVIPDIDFYNMLIKKRCLRMDHAGAIEVKAIIEQEIKSRKRKYHLKKKHHLRKNIMTYGVLAMACDTKEKAECLLIEMKEEQLKVNIEILGALLKHGTVTNQFEYITYIIQYVTEENLKPNEMFIKHLEYFNERCTQLIHKSANGLHKCSPEFVKSFKKCAETYNKLLKRLDIDETLATEHPWRQFQKAYPETVQHQHITIKEPKTFYKRDRTFVNYKPRLK